MTSKSLEVDEGRDFWLLSVKQNTDINQKTKWTKFFAAFASGL